MTRCGGASRAPISRMPTRFSTGCIQDEAFQARRVTEAQALSVDPNAIERQTSPCVSRPCQVLRQHRASEDWTLSGARWHPRTDIMRALRKPHLRQSGLPRLGQLCQIISGPESETEVFRACDASRLATNNNLQCNHGRFGTVEPPARNDGVHQPLRVRGVHRWQGSPRRGCRWRRRAAGSDRYSFLRDCFTLQVVALFQLDPPKSCPYSEQEPSCSIVTDDDHDPGKLQPLSLLTAALVCRT